MFSLLEWHPKEHFVLLDLPWDLLFLNKPHLFCTDWTHAVNILIFSIQKHVLFYVAQRRRKRESSSRLGDDLRCSTLSGAVGGGRAARRFL